MLSVPRTILITGGSGLAGRNFREHPRLYGHRLLAPPHAELDLCDYVAVHDYLQRHGVEIIVHAAGRVGGIAANARDPYTFLSDNLCMGLNLVRAAHDAGIRTLLNLSSSCTYPCAAPNPLREESLLTGSFEPTNEGYALAKIAVLKACAYLTAQGCGFAYKTLIPCNLYGRYDSYDPQNSHFMPAIIRKLHEARCSGAGSVEIWGDGRVTREVMYAGDLAEAMVLCLERFEHMPAVMNVGTGVGYSIDHYYATAARVIGIEVDFTHDLSRPSGMQQKVMDISAQRRLGFEPAWSLEQGVSEAYAYYCELQAG